MARNAGNQKKSNDLRKRAEALLIKQKRVWPENATDDYAKQLIHELEVHQIELELQNEELRRTQEKLEASRSKYADLYDFAPVGYFTLDNKGLILESNLTGAGKLVTKRTMMVKKPFARFLHKDNRDLFYLHIKHILKTKSGQSIDVRLKGPAAADLHARLECLPVTDTNGNVFQIRTSLIDISEYKRVERLLMLAEEEWERTFDTIPDIVMVTDDQYRIKKVNRALVDRLGVKRDDLLGHYCYEVIHGADTPPSYCPHVKTITKGKEKISEIFEDNLKGHFILSSSPVCDSEGSITGAVEIFRDISARKKMEEKLRATSMTDELTGLLNRRGFLTLSEQQCKLSDRTKRSLALLYIDLDDMKKINDEFGHETGDQALVDTAGILKNSFRGSDIIARIGGDEFSILLTEPPKTGIENIIINNVQDNMKAFNEKSGRNYKLSLSMGFAYFDPERKCSIGDLINRADASMYEDKKRHISKETLSALTGKKPEKRKHRRIQTGDTFRAEIGAAGTADVKDISYGGICLTNLKRLTTSKFRKFILYCGDKKVPVKGKVIWTRLKGPVEYEAGFKFFGLTHNDTRSLETMITGLKTQ
jgi:diguanylate cyclase (GGDEF)-like protein/PAS domain S-box-containing protein